MGRPKQDGTSRFNPCEEIIWKYIEEKGIKNRFRTMWRLKKMLFKHLHKVGIQAVNSADGIYFPNRLGKLQVLGFEQSTPPVDIQATRKSFKEGHNKVIYLNNFHSDGLVYKTFYRKYNNTTKEISLATFKYKDLWTFKLCRDLQRNTLRDLIKNNTVRYHILTKDLLSNRYHYNKRRSISNIDPEHLW